MARARLYAEAFEGTGLKPGKILANCKRVRSALGYSLSAEKVLDTLFRFTRPIDWEEGSPIGPVVWPSNDELIEQTHLQKRTVQACLRQLIRVGLICPVDSANGKRYGTRDRTSGHILRAYGFSLAPCGTRYVEFAELIEEMDARKAERRALRSAFGSLCRDVRMICTAEVEVGAAQFRDWLEETERLAERARRTRTLDALKDLVARVTTIVAQARAAFDQQADLDCRPKTAERNEETTPLGESNGTHITTTTQTQPYGVTVGLFGRGSGRTDRTLLRHRDMLEGEIDDHKITAAMAFELLVEPSLWARERPDHWAVIEGEVEAIVAKRSLPHSLWSDLREVAGRRGAVLSILIAERRALRGDVQNFGGYVRSMMRRAAEGQLRLGGSVYGELDRAKSDRVPVHA